MNIGAIVSSAIQNGIRPSEISKPISLPQNPGMGAGSISSFNEILNHQLLQPQTTALQTDSTQAISGTHSHNLVSQMVDDVQKLNNNATEATQKVLEGNTGSLHSAMIAMEEASVSFQLLTEMRNKVVESLQELLRMQI